jgi:hypothetical protein
LRRQAEIGVNSNTRPCFAASAISPLRNCQSDGVELFRIVQRKIRRPPSFVLNELGQDFSSVAAPMNEFDGFSGHRIFRRMKKNSQGAIPQRIAPRRPTPAR